MGVLTTQETKLASLATFNTYLTDGAVRIASNFVSVDQTVFKPNAVPETAEEVLDTLREQLIAFQVHQYSNPCHAVCV